MELLGWKPRFLMQASPHWGRAAAFSAHGNNSASPLQANIDNSRVTNTFARIACYLLTNIRNEKQKRYQHSIAPRAFFHLGDMGNTFTIWIIIRQYKSCFLFSSIPVSIQRQTEGKNFPTCLIVQRALADSAARPPVVSGKGGYLLSSSALSRLRNINST